MRLSLRSAWAQSAACLLLMAATVYLESWTSLDMIVQRSWYDVARHAWLIDPAAHRAWRWLFYDGMKGGVAVVGVCSVFLLICGFVLGRRSWMRTGLLMALSCAATPLLVSALKAVTGVYCPKQLAEFGGSAAYRHLSMIFSGVSGGRCFPGGHASGGFALTMAFFCVADRRRRVVALVLALSVGWIMGLYQMLRGEHFLSHTIMSMLLAWQMNILLTLLAERVLLPALERKRWPGKRDFTGARIDA